MSWRITIDPFAVSLSIGLPKPPAQETHDRGAGNIGQQLSSAAEGEGGAARMLGEPDDQFAVDLVRRPAGALRPEAQGGV